MEAPLDVVERARVFRENARRGRWTVTLQGGLLQVQQAGYGIQWTRRPTRGPASPFSQASRRRLLFRLARIDWSRLSDARFVTLTYPDAFADRPLRRRTIDRDLFHRDMENYVGGPIASIWRTEWQVRKSGKRKGQPMPHVHMVLMTNQYIPFDYVNTRWKNILGTHVYCRTEIDRAGKVREVVRYCAKYLTKADLCSLVIASYLSRVRGRPWGIKRPKLIPWMPERSVQDVPWQVICHAREIAARRYPPIAESVSGGFTLLGDDVHKLFDGIEDALLTGAHAIV